MIRHKLNYAFLKSTGISLAYSMFVYTACMRNNVASEYRKHLLALFYLINNYSSLLGIAESRVQ